VTVRYKPDIADTGRLMKGPEMQALMREIAEEGKALAESIAPVETGEYKSSFRVEVTAHGGLGVGGDRAQANLINDSPHAAYVEWQDNKHVLAKAADYMQKIVG
jgi:hypothetical protein